MIKISRLSLLGVAMLAFGTLFPISGWPAGLWWLIVIPLTVLAWVLRSRTTISATGLHARSLIGSRKLEWSQVKGVRFPKHGYARAVLSDGTETTLPAVSFDRLSELAAHSGGHIPDPYAT